MTACLLRDLLIILQFLRYFKVLQNMFQNSTPVDHCFWAYYWIMDKEFKHKITIGRQWLCYSTFVSLSKGTMHRVRLLDLTVKAPSQQFHVRGWPFKLYNGYWNLRCQQNSSTTFSKITNKLTGMLKNLETCLTFQFGSRIDLECF